MARVDRSRSRGKGCIGRSSTPSATPPPNAASPRPTISTPGDNFGSGFFEVNQHQGFRWSAARAFLRPALRRTNLRLVTGALVQRLTVADGRVNGVGSFAGEGDWKPRPRGRRSSWRAGAIGSPHILQLSGIGPGGLLRGHGVDVIVDRPGVGANLQDHLQIRAVYQVSGAATLNGRAGSLFGRAGIALEYALRRRGAAIDGAQPAWVLRL